MKNILPIITVLGAGVLVAAGSDSKMNSNPTQNKDIQKNVENFEQNFKNYSQLNEQQLSKEKLNKYKLTFVSPVDATLVNSQTIEQSPAEDIPEAEYIGPEIDGPIKDGAKPMPLPFSSTEENRTTNNVTAQVDNGTALNTENYNNSIDQQEQENDDNINLTTAQNEQISTLYSISTDIENSCEDFCELKEELTEAILETENLLNKVQNREIELTSEQKLLITEQSNELKNLGKHLSRLTNELSLSLSDLGTLLANENGNLDSLSLKYLVVLNNLLDGNEMLENSLSSLNLMNNMFRINSVLPPNNTGRILYGFQQNNQPPVIKDYLIDNNGNVVENKTNPSTSHQTETKEVDENSETATANNNSNKNIDTLNTKPTNSNIDSFYANTPHNIDTFFNTALLNNEFMYGNGYGSYGGNFAGGMGGYGAGFPYGYNQYQNYQNASNNPNYGVNNNNNTQDEDTQSNTINKKSKFKLTKNIDTYKDANTPSLSVKLNNFKKNVSAFFEKFSKPEKYDTISNDTNKLSEEKQSTN